MRKCISLIIAMTMLFLFASCKAEKEALSLTGETKLAPANKNEPLVADAPIEEPKTEASTADGKTSEQTTSKEIDEIVSRVLDELRNTTEVTTEMVTTPENKTIPLNVETSKGDGNLTIKSAKLDYEFNRIIFNYTDTDSPNAVPVMDGIKLTGNSGKSYRVQIAGNGIFSFTGVTDFTDLSTVTLTYQFEGFDPVTVTFNIPV